MLTKQELRQLQPKEITEELTKTSRELIKARMEHSSQTLKETHRLSALKKHIARIKTVMHEGKGKVVAVNEVKEVKEVKEPKKELKTKTTKAKKLQ
jgi:large subunit ribosomal protein L29